MAKAKKSKLTIEDALVPVEEQPYEIPENWCWTKIGAVCEFERGITFPASAKESEPSDTNIPCLRTANIQEELDVEDLLYVDKSYMKGNDAKLVRRDDIIMSSANSRELVGKVSYVHDVSMPMTFGGFVLGIRANKINPRYLFYDLRYEFLCGNFMGESTQTTNIANINTTTLSNYKIPLPPLAEQKRIVEQIENLFAKLDEAKEKAQNALDMIGSRKESILVKALDGYLTESWRKDTGIKKDSWTVRKIDELSDVKGGKRVPKGMSLVSEDTGHPYIKAGNLKKGTVIDDGIQYVPADVLEYIKNYTVRAGDVYITNVGACIGDCGVIPEKYDGANLTENAVKMTNLKECESQFLAYYLASNYVQQIIKGLIASATLGKLSIANIKGIEINLPKVEEQREIVKIIEELFVSEDNVANSIEKVLDEIELMKKSILAKAFRGELGTNIIDEESSIELLKQILENN